MSDTQLTETPGAGHNLPDPIEAKFDELKARSEALVETANKWIEERPEIKTEDEATKARDFKDQLRKQWLAIENERKEVKAPHKAAAEAVDAQYNPLKAPVGLAGKIIGALETVWLNKQQAILDEQRRQEEAKAKAARDAADKAARDAASEKATIQQRIEAEEAQKVAAQAEKVAVAPAPRAQIKSAYGGRASFLRKNVDVEIEDATKIPAKYLRRLCAQPYVTEALVRAVKADLAAYKDVAGISIKEGNKAV